MNQSKSSVVHFRGKRVKRDTYQFKIGQNTIEYTDCYKYLGVYFNEHMEYDFTAAQFAESGQRALGSVFTNINIIQTCVIKPLKRCTVST